MDNFQRLGAMFDGRIKKTSNAAVPTTVELGTINSNLSLSTDSLGGQIPKGEYMVDIRLCAKSYSTDTVATYHGSHSHQLPEDFRGIQGGDRVMVIWCGNEPVVVAIVVSS